MTGTGQIKINELSPKGTVRYKGGGQGAGKAKSHFGSGKRLNGEQTKKAESFLTLPWFHGQLNSDRWVSS